MSCIWKLQNEIVCTINYLKRKWKCLKLCGGLCQTVFEHNCYPAGYKHNNKQYCTFKNILHTAQNKRENNIWESFINVTKMLRRTYHLLLIPCMRMEEGVISPLLMRNPKLRNVDCSAKYPCTGWRMMMMMMVMMIMMATIMRNRSYRCPLILNKATDVRVYLQRIVLGADKTDQ